MPASSSVISVCAVVLLLGFLAPAPVWAQSVVRSVSTSTDDAEQYVSGGSVDLTSSDLELPFEPGEQYIGMRFQNITVPVGATVTAANIQFHVDETAANTAVTLTFYGEDVNDAATFTTSNNNIWGRTRTTASVNWAVSDWVAVNDEGAAQLTGDLSTIIQEIVDRGGWASGNDIVIVASLSSGTGTRIAESYDGEAASAPEITITYTTDTTPPSAPVITQPTTPTSDSTPIISGTASEDGGTITLTSDLDGALTPTGTVTGGTWSITLTSALSVGTHSLTATHTDAATNVSAASGAKSIEIQAGLVRSISTGSDDAEQAVSGGSVDLTSSDLELPFEGAAEQYIGMRFQNITIPTGATISEATIQFQVDETAANTAVTLTFYGEDVDDAATFTTTNNDIWGRTRTTASVNWAVNHWAAVDDEGADQKTADLATIIQEIVDRGGWASGNDIVIVAALSSGTGTRIAESYEGEPSNAPEITILYTGGDTTPPSAPVITQPTTPTTDNTPVISGTASEDGGTITITSDLDGVLTPTGTVTAGVWSITLTSALSNGIHSLTATHKDASTNESAASGAKNLEVDAPFTVAIAASADDAEEVVSTGVMSLTGNVLEHIDNSGTFENSYIGLRFQGITIPKGATIDAANIQYAVHTVDADVAITVTFVGEDIDDAPTFTTTAYDISGRTQTTASVNWSPAHWAAVDDRGAAQKTADIASIIQEIVDRSGWASGNDLVIIVKPSSGSGRRQPKSWDNDAANAPELTIEFTPDTTAPTAPVVTQPTSPDSDTTPVISGTASEDDGTITLTSDVDGVLTPTGTVTGGAWSITLTSALSNGTHSITATHTDAAGNVSAVSGGKTLAIEAPIVVSIAASDDDAEETTSSGAVLLTGSVLELPSDAGAQDLKGMRFRSIAIPAGATITSADIQFNVYSVTADVAVTVTIVGEDIDDAPAFTTTAYDISGRTETTASVDWAIPHWAAIDDEGAAQKTDDLSTIIQEIVDRAGWASGNDVVLMVKASSGSGQRNPDSWDYSATDAPELSITFTTDTTAPTAPVITQPTTPDSDRTPTISGTASEDGGTITLTSDVDGVLAPTATVTGGAWSIALTSSLSVTTHSLTATHTDAAGNVSSASSAKTLKITEGISHDRRLWLATIDDNTGSGAPGLDSWGEDDVLEFSDGSLLLEPTDTSGEFSLIPSGFDSLFDDGSVALFALHYVSSDITVGGGANTFALQKGDLLFALEEDETIGADGFGDKDIHVLRPTTAGDYSAGTFYHLLDDVSTADNYGLTLVEYDTYVGDMLLNAGEFLFIDATTPTEIRHFAPTGVGAGTTTGTTSVFLNTTGLFGVSSGFDSLELIEVPTTIGGQTLAAGTILASVMGDAGTVGDATALSVEDEDIFQLAVNTTFMTSATSSAVATMLFDGSVVNLSAGSEDLKAVTIWKPDPQAFRSKATGNWSAGASWERYNGTDWITSANFPWSSEAAAITVQSGHTITVDASVGDSLTVDQLTVSSGGTVVVNQRTVVVDGSGTDATVAGTLTINSGKVFTPTGASTVSVSSGGVVSNSGTFNVAGTSAVTFTSGGTYTHAQNGGAFPQAARTTWDSGSTAQVTGTTTSIPSELGDAFHHFTWNAASQSAKLDLNAAITSIGGDLTITSTGTDSLSWVQSLNTNLAIGGNYVQTGGTFIYTDGAGTGTMSAVDVSVTGGTLILTTSTGTPTLDIDDDLVVSGGGVITETGTGSGTITFTGTAQQDVTAASGITNDINVVVNNTGGILLLSDLSAPADLTATAGDIDAGGYDIYVAGDLTLTSDLTNAATVSFNGASGNQSVSYAAGTWSVPTLDVNKASGSLLLGTAATITTTACVTSGTLDVNGQTLTFPHGTSLYNGGTVTGNVVFERTYSLVQDGWRMIASPLAGVNYSSLNTNFHTQGAPWADYANGTATLQEEDFAAQDWTLIDGADANFGDGDGYIFYMYEALLGSTILPATWSVTGTVRTSASRALSWNTISTDSYNYVGNRTTGNIDWDAAYAASTNVATTYSTWDPVLTSAGGLSGYKYYNQATGTGLAGRYIAPFTAFQVEPTASGGTFVFSNSCAANQASANYFGKRAGALADSTAREVSPHIRLMVEGEGHAELETYLVFDERADRGPDDFDGNRMRPLSQDYVTLISMEGGRNLVFDGRSMAEGRQEYTLGLAATKRGIYTLTWPDWHDIPADWSVTLYDREDGRRVDLRDEESFVFQVDEPSLRSEGGLTELNATPRFNLTVAAPGFQDPAPEILPTEFLLAQNYPNPFNPVTTIRYALPAETPVQIDVFDMLGRRVSQLVNGTEKAGWHEVRWDAGHLPSGLYVYRLSLGETDLVKTMMLLR